MGGAWDYEAPSQDESSKVTARWWRWAGSDVIRGWGWRKRGGSQVDEQVGLAGRHGWMKYIGKY